MKKVLLLNFLLGTLSVVNAQNPASYWPFDNNIIDTVADADGNVQPDNYVIPYDETDFKTGSSSIEFDGNYYLNCLNPLVVKNINAFTVAFWMKWEGGTGNQSIFEKDGVFRIIILDGKYLDFVVATENNSWYSINLGAYPTPPVDKWVHLAFFYDGSKLVLSINGGEFVFEKTGITGKMLENNNSLLIGGGAGNFKGKLDDLRFYNTALDSAAIKHLADPYGITSPVSQWMFDNNTLDTVADADGNVQPGDYTVPYADKDVRQGSSSIEFDGNFYLNCLDPVTVKNLDAFTVALWMKWNGGTGNQSIFEKDGKFRIVILDGGYLDFVVATENKGWYSISVQKFPIPPVGKWIHIAFYYDGSKIGFNFNGGENIYETAENSITGKVIDNGSVLTIGGGLDKFKGKLDDLRFYNTALSAKGIKELYDSYPADLEPPTTPANLTYSNTGETSVDLSWDASTDDSGIAAYYILKDDVLADTVINSTSVTVPGLKPETEFSFAVIAVDLNGNLSDTSNVVTVKTKANSDFEAPIAPTNLQLWDAQFTSIFIGWTASTDNIAVTGYKVYQNGLEIQTTTDIYAEIKSLPPGTSFKYTVKAFDAAGNMSEASQSLTASTVEVPLYPATLVANWTFESNIRNVVPEATEFDGNVSNSETLYYSNDSKEGTNSLSFDEKAFLNCGEPVAATKMEAFSIAFWMKMSKIPESNCVLVQEGSEYTIVAETIGQDSVRLLFGIATDNVAWYGGAGSFLYDTTIIHSGEWHHVAFVYSGAKTKIYIDGNLSMENQYYITGKTLENGNNLVIGGQTNMGFFNGLMDDARFYTGALTDDEVKQLTNVTSAEIINDFGKDISIYPNPVTNRVFIKNIPEKSEVRIFTFDGKLVYNTFSEANFMSVDVKNLINGVYLINIKYGSNRSVKKFVVTK